MQLKPRPERGANAAADRVNFFMRTGADLALSSHPQPIPARQPSFTHALIADKWALLEGGAGGEKKNACGDEPHQQQPMASLLGHAVLETLASVLLGYASLYMPSDEHDHLKQYVGAACVFTMVMALKDSNHFFPDGSPFVTVLLWAATLYTDRRHHTHWDEIRARLFGQLLGLGVGLLMVHHNRTNLQHHADLLAPHSGLWVHSVNEGLASLLGCVAATFATLSLIVAQPDGDAEDDDRDDEPVQQQDQKAQTTKLLKSKAEAVPPTNDELLPVALSLAAVHYALTRVFEAHLSPTSAILQLYIREEPDPAQWLCPLLGQAAGALLAGVYVRLCVPSHEAVRRTLRARRKRR